MVPAGNVVVVFGQRVAFTNRRWEQKNHALSTTLRACTMPASLGLGKTGRETPCSALETSAESSAETRAETAPLGDLPRDF